RSRVSAGVPPGRTPRGTRRPALHGDERGVLPPLEDLVEAHHRTAAARCAADVHVVGEFADEAQAAPVLRVRRGRTGRGAGAAAVGGGKAGPRVGHLDAALLAV